MPSSSSRARAATAPSCDAMMFRSGGRVPTIVAGPPLMRMAGVTSGTAGSAFLDASLPPQGIVREIMARAPRGQRPAERCMDHGDDAPAPQLLQRAEAPLRMTGNMPCRGSRSMGALPGYGGYVPGKVAENVYGGSFRVENDHTIRTLANRDTHRAMADTLRSTVPEPDSRAKQQRRHGATIGLDGTGLNNSSHVPGYMVEVPGKNAESVYGTTPAEASRQAHALRRYNPHVNSEGWLRGGIFPSDRRSTYSLLHRAQRMDSHTLFSGVQEEQFLPDVQRMGGLFGLKVNEAQIMGAGDRYKHLLTHGASGGHSSKKGRADISLMGPAGVSTYSSKLEEERHRLHKAMCYKATDS